MQKYCTQLNKWYFNQHHAALTAWSSSWYQWKFIFLKFLHLIAMKAISWLPFIFMKFNEKLFLQSYANIFIVSTTRYSFVSSGVLMAKLMWCPLIWIWNIIWYFISGPYMFPTLYLLLFSYRDFMFHCFVFSGWIRQLTIVLSKNCN